MVLLLASDVQDTVAILAIVIAFISLAVALCGARDMRESVKMQKREHEAYLARLEAIPKLDVVVRANAPEGEISDLQLTPLTNTWIRLSVGAENVGKGDAEDILLNLCLPQFVQGFRWTNGQGAEHGELPSTDSLEVLSDGTNQHPIQWLQKQDLRVARGRHVASYFAFWMAVEPGKERTIPVWWKFQSPDFITEENPKGLVQGVEMVRFSAPELTPSS